MRYCVIIVLIVSFSTARGSDGQVRIDANGVDNAVTVKFWKFEENRELLTDSLLISTNGVFNFKFNIFSPTLYAIQFNRGHKIEFLLTPDYPIITLGNHIDSLLLGIATINSNPEIEAYNALLSCTNVFETTYSGYLKQWNTLAETDSQVLRQRKQLEFKIGYLAQQFDSVLTSLKIKYSNTYTAKVLVPLSWKPTRINNIELHNKFDTEYSFQHYHYWDSVPFSSSELLRHPLFKKRLSNYMNAFVPNNKEGIKSALDIIFNRDIQLAVKEFLMTFFIEKLSQKEYYDLIDYLSTTYFQGCSGRLQTNYQEIIKNAKRLSVGNVIENDIILKDVNGKFISLKDIVKSSKSTVLYFWQPSCSHCNEFNRQLAEKTGQLKQKKINIYAVCIESNVEIYTQAVKQENISWNCVVEPQGWQSSIVASYNIHQTPQIFILDKGMKILAKSFAGNELVKTLQDLNVW